MKNKDEFERFIKALEALYKSKFINYYDIITQVYGYGFFGEFKNEQEFRRLELRDKKLAKNLDLIRDIFLIMELDKSLGGGKTTRLDFFWLKNIIEDNSKLIDDIGITLSSFEDFSVSEKIKLFFEALLTLNKNQYFRKAIEVYDYKNVEIGSHNTRIRLKIDFLKSYLQDILSDKNKVRVIGLILGVPRLLECIESQGESDDLEVYRYNYTKDIRTLIHNHLVDNYLKNKNQIDELINQISLNEK